MRCHELIALQKSNDFLISSFLLTLKVSIGYMEKIETHRATAAAARWCRAFRMVATKTSNAVFSSLCILVTTWGVGAAVRADAPPKTQTRQNKKVKRVWSDIMFDKALLVGRFWGTAST